MFYNIYVVVENYPNENNFQQPEQLSFLASEAGGDFPA